MPTGPRAFEASTCLNAAERIDMDLVRLTASLTENQFHAQPRSGGWSAAYCVEHLVLTGLAFLPKWDAALAQAADQRQAGSAAVLYRWWHRALLSAMEHPRYLRLRTASPFVPRSRRPMREVVARFVSMHAELKRRIERGGRSNAICTHVQSPFASWLWYPLGFSFDLALAHERRHLEQAWRAWREVEGESVRS